VADGEADGELEALASASGRQTVVAGSVAAARAVRAAILRFRAAVMVRM
jgi:hypothetical protein